MAAECAVCGGELPAQAGPGRPARYCGEVCRRTREFEIRGVLRRVQRAEDEEQRARFELTVKDWPDAAERRDWWQAEVDRLGGELRGLIR